MLHNNTPTPALSVFHPQPQLHLSAYLLAVFFFCKRKHDSLTRLVKCYGQKWFCSKSSYNFLHSHQWSLRIGNVTQKENISIVS